MGRRLVRSSHHRALRASGATNLLWTVVRYFLHHSVRFLASFSSLPHAATLPAALSIHLRGALCVVSSSIRFGVNWFLVLSIYNARSWALIVTISWNEIFWGFVKRFLLSISFVQWQCIKQSDGIFNLKIALHFFASNVAPMLYAICRLGQMKVWNTIFSKYNWHVPLGIKFEIIQYSVAVLTILHVQFFFI